MAQEFKIIAAKNPAQELLELHKSLDNCCEIITEGKNGETLFEGFDLTEWIVEKFEEIALKYASMANPGQDDGISYMRKGENPSDEVVEYNNGITSAYINLVLEPTYFEPK